MISKHVQEILDLFRLNYRNIKCAQSNGDTYKKWGVESQNLFPDEDNTNEVLALSNNKSITTDDLEFATITNINGNSVVFLGNYRFYFDEDVFKI